MILPYILIGIAVLIVIFLIVIAMQASDFRTARSTTIAAPPEIVFAQVNDLRKMDAWSPWMKFDPAVKITHEGAPTGLGAIEIWSGNNRVGEGRMTIIESRPNELIRLKLEFMRPFKATNTGEFTFNTQNNQTTVTWAMFGPRNFMSKAMGLMMNFDKMIGGQFEKGLAELKTIAERAAKA
ncbi:MAG TPA: SRPBCC family protein [Tepidisphaeraceae bacterium]|jgi:uncharacterized protein YndB with AHSA1/START domain|nr:SRPBCC family protein [Tepidisphaeraceae bacterium]